MNEEGIVAFYRVGKSPHPHNPKNPMTTSVKNNLLKQNTICWLGAIIVPLLLHFGLGSTKFPWPVILPVLIVGLMLASNRLLSKAIGKTTDDPNH